MPRITHFEIPADDPDRAAEFYTRTFGWKISKWEGPQPYWLVETGKDPEPGINGGITLRKSLAHTANTVAVPSCDKAMKAVAANGGKVLTPKMTVPGQGYMAYCLDSEGNQFGIMEMDPKAK
jgi:predicted enzyme related to lactoylglutathione lyase